MVTSNGVGAGHLIRASAIARELKPNVRPIIFSMAYSVVEVANALGLECEFVPGRDKGLMPRRAWDDYLCQRLVALIDETGASVVTFDGVVPYPGLVAAKFARPHISLVWIRRGLWQKKPQGVLLGLQSKLMDYVIEPGDVARDADFGPTKNRKEALLVEPVTLYQHDHALTRIEARKKLGVDIDKPTVLVQMGVGSTDLDARISAVFRGLQSWEDLQIVMARKPVDESGNSLLPHGMKVHTIRHFPLADLLHGFDAAVCAAGYNSVHEVIPAGLPTLFIANNRGTDDQFSRAQHCADLGLALYAKSDSLEDIQHQAAKLAFATLRADIRNKCHSVSQFSGASKIAALLTTLTDESYSALVNKRFYYQRFIALAAYLRSPKFYMKRLVNAVLRALAIGFRTLFPHQDVPLELGEVVFSDSRNHILLDKYIRNPERFEHLLENASHQYVTRRKAIARNAYGEVEITPIAEHTEIEAFFRFAS
jgi:UDP:flavonoid glycosyltransferase YjiC (YdhE family)